MSSTSKPRSARIIPLALLTLAVLGLSVVAVGSAAPPADQANTSSAQSEKTHTLVIKKTTGKPVRYAITASKGITGETAENDTIQGKSLSGRVGPYPWQNKSNDTKDVINYIGHIQSFQIQGGDAQVLLNGQRVQPSVLDDNYIEIRNPNANGTSKQPVQYQITVTGDAIGGEKAEKKDTTNATKKNAKTNSTTIRGRLTDRADSFYFGGNITSSSFDGQAHVFINGQRASVTKPTATPTTTSTPSPTVTENKPPATSTTVSERRTDSRVTTTTTSANITSATTTNSSNSELFISVVGGIFLLLVVAFSTLWIFSPRERRW